MFVFPPAQSSHMAAPWSGIPCFTTGAQLASYLMLYNTELKHKDGNEKKYIMTNGWICFYFAGLTP